MGTVGGVSCRTRVSSIPFFAFCYSFTFFIKADIGRTDLADTQFTSHTDLKGPHPYPLLQKGYPIHLKNCISFPSGRGTFYRNSVNWLMGWMCSTVDQRETKMLVTTV